MTKSRTKSTNKIAVSPKAKLTNSSRIPSSNPMNEGIKMQLEKELFEARMHIQKMQQQIN